MSNLSSINTFDKPVGEPKVPKWFAVTDPYLSFEPILFKAHDEMGVLKHLAKDPVMIERYLSGIPEEDETGRLEQLEEALYFTLVEPTDLTGGGTNS